MKVFTIIFLLLILSMNLRVLADWNIVGKILLLMVVVQ